VGWKVAAGSAAARAHLGIATPLVGYLAGDGVERVVEVGGLAAPLLEAELVARLGADVDPGATAEAVAAAVGGVSAGVEIADVDPAIVAAGVEEIVASNVFHAARVDGSHEVDLAELDLARLRTRIDVAGSTVADAVGADALGGSVTDLLAQAADVLALAGERLRAGDRVYLGSLVPPVPIAARAEILVRVGPFPPFRLRTS